MFKHEAIACPYDLNLILKLLQIDCEKVQSYVHHPSR